MSFARHLQQCCRSIPRLRPLSASSSIITRSATPPLLRFSHIDSSWDVSPRDRPGQIANASIKTHPARSPLSHESISDLKIYDDPAESCLKFVCPSRGVKEPVSIDHEWLRDICQEVGTSIQAGTGQKLFHTSDIDPDNIIHGEQYGLLHPDHPPYTTTSPSGEPQLVLTFGSHFTVINAFSKKMSPEPIFPLEKHVSRLSLELILKHASGDNAARAVHDDIGGQPRPWEASDLTAVPLTKGNPPTKTEIKPTALPKSQTQTLLSDRPIRVPYSALLDGAPDSTHTRWAIAKGLVEDGLVFVTGMPSEVRGSETNLAKLDSPELARLAQMFGEIRNTFYGPLWDVRSLPSAVSKNIAYTNVDLGLHMDLLYFQNPPRFQFLHMVENKVKGGESIFVDSFKIAEWMWEHASWAWETLTSTPVQFHYKNDNRHYHYSHPTFEQARDGHDGPPFSSNGMPRLTAVNYSPPFQAPHILHPPPQHGNVTPYQASNPKSRRDFYRALKIFAEATLDPKYMYERQLNKGECVIFDNRRVLHSRKGFEYEDDGSGVAEGEDKVKRWLKGCYVDGDAIWSSYRVLKQKFEQEQESIK